MNQSAPGKTTKTTCAYCGVGCGVIVTEESDGSFSVKGDPEHPANYGRLCSKGSALAETIGVDGRLRTPIVDGQETDWDSALDLVARKFSETIEAHGPDSVAFYVSGQLLTEDYYVANKLMKGYIGSANIDTNSRLCMASSVAGHRRAFGTDTVPGNYEDLEEADLIVLTGSNLAWCHPVLYQRIVAAKEKRPDMRVVNIDPRRTATSDLADLHLPLKAGSDVALFNRLLVELDKREKFDRAYIDAHVNGFEEALAAAQADSTDVLDLAPADLATFLDWWCETEKTVTIYSQGVNQSTSGADKVNAILNCHLATARIGKAGAGPFSVTGQPNAMGGREVGGLANMLACHLDIENEEHRNAVQSFWSAPSMPDGPGLKAVDMFKAVGEGKIKALWIMCTNPAVSMPDADAVAKAIEGCDFVAVSEMFATTDTAKLADVLLPATGWAEKDGTVTNSDRTISRQRGFLSPAGQARHDWDIIADVGRRMGWSDAFAFDNQAQIFNEYADLSAQAGRRGRDFDISKLLAANEAYEHFTPRRWGKSRFFADGQFFHADGKAKMLAVTCKAPQSSVSKKYPFRFNTGRVRDHWHTMTRTGRTPRLSQHMAEPYLEMHPEDAQNLTLKPADLVTVTSPQGRAILRLVVTDRVRRGETFAPMHWTGEYAPSGRIDALVAPNVDPVSGQPESKASAVHVAKFDAGFYAYAIAQNDVTPDCAYWAKARIEGGWQLEFAGTCPENWEEFARDLFGAGDFVSVIDAAKGIARIGVMREGKLIGALFASPHPVALARGFLSNELGTEDLRLLAGRPGMDQPDPGPTICACFNVGVNTILRAVEQDGLMSVEAIGAALSAGTNCGSCKPEIAALLERYTVQEAAE